VVLRYLETQPADSPVAAILSNPWLALAFDRPRSHVFLRRLLADVWPTARLRATVDSTHLSRDAAVNAAYDADPKVHRVVTPGAWKEIQWAQRAVAAERARIESPLLFLLAGEDRLVDAHHARAFADGLQTRVQVQWYPEMYHEILQDPRAEDAVNDILRFLAGQGV
jgi:lysophospholipase